MGHDRGPPGVVDQVVELAEPLLQLIGEGGLEGYYPVTVSIPGTTSDLTVEPITGQAPSR